MNIPDLRPHNNEVTLEHCSALLEQLGPVFKSVYSGDEFLELVGQIPADEFRDDILEMFSTKAFLKLFETQVGRGIMLGCFIQKHLFTLDEEDGDLYE